MKLTKNKKLDKRMKFSRFIKQNKQVLKAMVVLAILFALIFVPVVYKWLKSPMLSPLGREIDNKVVVNAVEVIKPFCKDVISCIRDVGESLEVSNQNIMTMIRIGKCESGHRENAMGVNTNKTVDRGVFQLNSIHKGISNQDAFTYELNIRYAYKMFLSQGFQPWISSKNCWSK